MNLDPEPAERPRNVFVVHGRNLRARDALFQYLRALDVRPLEWAEAVNLTGKATPYVGEILDAAFAYATAVVVLLTPDDRAELHEELRADDDPEYERTLTSQPRQNVLFEAGMAIGRDERRVILLQLGFLRPFSDVWGRYILKMDDSTGRRQELALRLRSAGCRIDLESTAWQTAGGFVAAIKPVPSDAATVPVRPSPDSPGDPSPAPDDEAYLPSPAEVGMPTGIEAQVVPEPTIGARARLRVENRGNRIVKLIDVEVSSDAGPLLVVGRASRLPKLLGPGDSHELQVASTSARSPHPKAAVLIGEDSVGKGFRLPVDL